MAVGKHFNPFNKGSGFGNIRLAKRLQITAEFIFPPSLLHSYIYLPSLLSHPSLTPLLSLSQAGIRIEYRRRRTFSYYALSKKCALVILRQMEIRF